MRTTLIIFFIAFTYFLSGQNTVYPFKNYTVDNGLPSNECYRVIQDKKGYIWIATDRGLCKFDGYNFKTYGMSKGLRDVTILNMQIDNKGNIWMSTLAKKLYIYQPEIDSIVPYKFNYKISKFANKSLILSDFYVDLEDNVYICMLGFPIIKVSITGNVILLMDKNIENSISVRQIENKVLVNRVTCDRNLELINTSSFYRYRNIQMKKKLELYVNEKSKGSLPLNPLPISKGDTHGFQFNDNYIISASEGTYLINKSKVVGFNFETVRQVIRTNDGYIAIAAYKDICLYQNLGDIIGHKVKECILKNVNASYILLDRDGVLWITTLDKGLLKIDLNSISIINSSKNSKIINITNDNNGSIIYVENKNEIKRYNIKTKSQSTITKSKAEIAGIYYDSTYNHLVVGEMLGSFVLKNGVKKWLLHKYNNVLVKTIAKHIVKGQNNRLIITYGTYLVTYPLSKSTTFLGEISIEKNKIRLNCALETNNDTILLGTNEGIYLFYDKTFKKLPATKDFLDVRINDIKEYNNKYILATMGNGIILWDSNNNLTKINKESGLVSDNIERLYIDKKGTIYVCTMQGLSILNYQSDSTYVVVNYTTSHGLPTNEVNDVTTIGNNVYVATAKGIVVITTKKQK